MSGEVTRDRVVTRRCAAPPQRRIAAADRLRHYSRTPSPDTPSLCVPLTAMYGLLSVLVTATISTSPTALHSSLTANGALSIALDGTPWIDGGITVLRDSAQWFASDCANMLNPKHCMPLQPTGALNRTSGTDELGEYVEESLAWTADGATRMVTGVRTYSSQPDIAVLTQTFPRGLKPQNKNGSREEIVSAFPTLARTRLDLGVLFYAGVQLQNTQFFKWAAGAPYEVPPETRGKAPEYDGSAQPLVLTAADGRTLLASPLHDFFTAAQVSHHL